MSGKTHNVALLGAGIFAKGVHLPALVAAPTLNLTAVYSRSRSTADTFLEAASKEPSLPKLDVYSEDSEDGKKLSDLLARSDIDTVVLALPIPLQPSILEQAWKAGKNTLSEKPVAKDVASALNLIDLYESEYKPKGILWGVLEQYPFDQAYHRGHEIAKSGALGDLRSYSLEFYGFVEPGSKYHATSWREKPEYQGGFLLDGGVHFFAGLRHLLAGADLELSQVGAQADLIHEHLAPHDTLQGFLQAVKIGSGASAPASEEGPALAGTFAISFAHESTTSRKYVLRGSKATLVIDFSSPKPVLTLKDKDGKVLEEKEYEAKAVEEEFKAWGAGLVAGAESEEWKDATARSGPRAVLRDLAAVEAGLSSQGVRYSLKTLVGQKYW